MQEPEDSAKFNIDPTYGTHYHMRTCPVISGHSCYRRLTYAEIRRMKAYTGTAFVAHNCVKDSKMYEFLRDNISAKEIHHV
jgi:hypothetical protein